MLTYTTIILNRIITLEGNVDVNLQNMLNPILSNTKQSIISQWQKNYQFLSKKIQIFAILFHPKHTLNTYN